MNLQLRRLDACVVVICTLIAMGCSTPRTNVDSQSPSDAAGSDTSAPSDAVLPRDATSATDVQNPRDAVIRGCALGTPGAWENITPTTVSLDPHAPTGAGDNFGTHALAVDPLDSATVYLGTSAQGFFRSRDCGATWVHINTGTNGDMLDHGRQWTIAIDPVDSNVIYTNAGYGAAGVFKSTNAGVDWQQVVPPEVGSAFVFGGFVSAITIDPTNHAHVLVSPHFSCTGSHAPDCFLESQDSGATWSVVDGVPATNGGDGSGQMMVDRDTWFLSETSAGLFRTSNHGATWTQVFQGYAAPSLYRSPDGAFYIPAAFNVIRSTDGIDWSAIPNSPGASVVTGSATHIYAGGKGCSDGNPPYQPFASAPVGDWSHWTTIPSPMFTAGVAFLLYDPDHHLLYASMCRGGAWRAVID